MDGQLTLTRGLTMIEVLVVVAIFAVLAGLGLTVGLETYRVDNFQAEVNRTVSVLKTARSRAMTNIDRSRHGVCWDAADRRYLIAAGDCAAADPEAVTVSQAAVINNWPTDGVMFEPLSGNVTNPLRPLTEITLEHEGQAATIEINGQGRIQVK